MRIICKILSFLTALLCLSVFSSDAQSAVSKVAVFSLDDLNGIYMPPELYVDIEFDDDNHNRILEALENGNIRLTISNRGGNSNGVSVSVTPEKHSKDLVFNTTSRTADIPQNGEVVLDFPVSAKIGIPTDSLRFDIKVKEPMGYDIEACMVLSTFEYQKARMHLSGVAIIDAGRGLRARNSNPDGKVQRGEVVKAVVTIQNAGVGAASGVRYEVRSKDPNVLLMTDIGAAPVIEGEIGILLSGETKEISFRLSANNNYRHTGEYLPVFVSVYEDKGLGNLVAENVPIPLDVAPKKPVIVDIKGEREQLLAMQQTKVYSTSDRISSSGQIRDISVAPAGVPIFKDAVAVVIGAEKNSYGVAPAPYAARDARVMAGYFKNSMGISDIVLKTDSEVTGTVLSDLFDPRYGYLRNSVRPGETDVFVFYSGHGIPDVSKDGTQDVFLLPYDARKELIRERGYSLNDLYANLDALNAKSVTVILDACFSGSSRYSATYLSENISNAKGVRISMPEMSSRPWDTNPEFRVFASSSGDQTSLGFDQSQSGLFTYYLALGLQGAADSDDDGVIRFDELAEYVTSNVSAQARNIRGADQTPQLFGNGDFVIEKIK